MTTLLEPPAPPAPVAPTQQIPAWGVSVDLTPGEVVQGRQTKVVQRMVILALVVVLLACGGLTLLAYGSRHSAQRSYRSEQAKTAALKSASRDYDGLVAVQQVIQQNSQTTATLMAQDVDFVKLLARIRDAVPSGVTITNLAVEAAPATTGTTGTTGSDADTGATIGSITIAGGGTRIKALAPFVASLNHMPGISDVVPTSTTQTDTGMVYALTMSYTDELYTHRFTASSTASSTGTSTGSDQ